jgi:hypothetical protein
VSEVRLEYVKDKETKGTFRFKPANEETVGNATIYLPKNFIKDAQIDPDKGFTMVIIAKES